MSRSHPTARPPRREAWKAHIALREQGPRRVGRSLSRARLLWEGGRRSTTVLRRVIRPSTTRRTSALWAKSLLNALLFFGIFMVLLPWGAHGLLPSTLPIPDSLRSWGGGALFCAGIAGWARCLDLFVRRGRGTPLPMDAPRHLITKGPFAVVRNPLMLAELSVIWSEVLYFASPGILAYAALISGATHLLVVHIEEPELRERFGVTYEVYCDRVPRWLPRLTRRRSSRRRTP